MRRPLLLAAIFAIVAAANAAKLDRLVLRQRTTAKVTWTFEPPSPDATIDRKSGRFVISKNCPPQKFVIYANIDNGARVLSQDVYVYTRELQPLIGPWQETAEIDCDSGKHIPLAGTPVNIGFGPDDTFTVVWNGFEWYVDYWGRYVFEPKTGRLALAITGGNYVPANIHPDGLVTIRKLPDITVNNHPLAVRELTLRNGWLGRQRDDDRAPRCGMVFIGYDN